MLRLLPLLAALIGAGFPSFMAHAQPAPAVLILEQGGPGLLAFADIAMHLRSAINQHVDGRVAIYAETLDLNRFGGPAYQKIQEDFMREKYAHIKFGVIVAIGRRALDYAVAYRSQVSAELPIVFAAVPKGAIDPASLPANVTGNTVDASFVNMLRAAQVVVPNLKRIVLVGDPLERQNFRFHFLQEMDAVKATVEIIDLTGRPMWELKNRVADLPDDSAIIYTTLNIDGDGKAFLPGDALEDIAKVANRPIIVDVVQHIERGATGGFLVDTARVGSKAGEVTARILRGEPVSAIPVTMTNGVRPVFNWKELQRWRVDERRLPPGSEVRFRQLSIWQQYPERIGVALFLVLIQAFLITGLILANQRRRAAEAEQQRLLGEVLQLNRFATAGQLTASLAHELRQPLSAIVAYAHAGIISLNAKTVDFEDLKSAFQGIEQDGHRADDVIKSVLAMFRKNEPPHIGVDVNLVIEQVLALCQQRLAAASIALNKKLSVPAPIVRGDPTQHWPLVDRTGVQKASNRQ